MLGGLADVGDALHGGGASADNPDHFVRQLVEAPVGVAAGVVVVPSAGVERVAFEGVDAGDAGQLGPAEGSDGHDHEPGPHPVVVVGVQHPPVVGVVPVHLVDPGSKADIPVQVEVAAQRLAVFQDLRPVGVLLLGHVAHLFQHGQVDVRLDIALHAGVLVPVPGAAEFGPGLDHADALHPELPQAGACQEPAESGADDGHIHLVGQRRPGDAGLSRIVQIAGELPVHGDVLVVAVSPQALVALLTVFLPEGVGVEVHPAARREGVGHGSLRYDP